MGKLALVIYAEEQADGQTQLPPKLPDFLLFTSQLRSAVSSICIGALIASLVLGSLAE